jgi:hypothetical protein
MYDLRGVDVVRQMESSAPRARRSATTASMLSTAKARWRIPSVSAAAHGFRSYSGLVVLHLEDRPAPLGRVVVITKGNWGGSPWMLAA